MKKIIVSMLFFVICFMIGNGTEAAVSSEVVSVHKDTTWFQRKDGFDVFGAVVDYSIGGDSETFTVNYKVMSSNGDVYQKIIDSSYIYSQYNGQWYHIGRKHDTINQKFVNLYLAVANTCAQKMGYDHY